MIFRFISLFILFGFYMIYLYKLISLNRQSIQTNQVGKGNKSQKVIFIEKTMSVSNSLMIVVQVLSILFADYNHYPLYIVVSLSFGFLSLLFFFLATSTMKKNWRVGIPKEKTSIVTKGIYTISRNPAFVGFDFLYLSNILLYFNIPLFLCSLLAMIFLHLQILQEEDYMEKTFGQVYRDYKSHTLR